MGSDVTCVVCPEGASQNMYDGVDFPQPLKTRNTLYELDGAKMTRQEVMTFMWKQFQDGETNNGVILGHVLLEMDDWEDGAALAHFRVN